MTKGDLSPSQLQQWLMKGSEVKPLLLDVREAWEYDIAKLHGAVLMPMQSVPDRLRELDRTKVIVCICHHGVRSFQVANFLSAQGFIRVFNMAGGIDAWSVQVDATIPRY